jgi:hypothetical protein
MIAAMPIWRGMPEPGRGWPGMLATLQKKSWRKEQHRRFTSPNLSGPGHAIIAHRDSPQK